MKKIVITALLISMMCGELQSMHFTQNAVRSARVLFSRSLFKHNTLSRQLGKDFKNEAGLRKEIQRLEKEILEKNNLARQNDQENGEYGAMLAIALLCLVGSLGLGFAFRDDGYVP